MSAARAERGYVLLIVLAAVAVLSVLAAFVHTQTENQLVMTTALKGQSVAASRATLAANAYLAQYKVNYNNIQASVSLLPTFASYTDAVAGGALATLPDALTDYSPSYGTPSLNLELNEGGGAQWCVDVWRLNRGFSVQPWTVFEVFGYYGYRRTGTITSCQDLANAGVVVSQVEVQIEQPTPNSGAPGSPGPAGGTGSSGGF
jgi:hypothetical protein